MHSTTQPPEAVATATCTRQLCVADITHHVLLFGLNG